jgi:hypothetical protein
MGIYRFLNNIFNHLSCYFLLLNLLTYSKNRQTGNYRFGERFRALRWWAFETENCMPALNLIRSKKLHLSVTCFFAKRLLCGRSSVVIVLKFLISQSMFYIIQQMKFLIHLMSRIKVNHTYSY